jgi:hypothetical protein
MCIEQEDQQEAAEKSTITMLLKTQEHDAVVQESQDDSAAHFIKMKRECVWVSYLRTARPPRSLYRRDSA